METGFVQLIEASLIEMTGRSVLFDVVDGIGCIVLMYSRLCVQGMLIQFKL